MNDRSGLRIDSLEIELARKIDVICRQFEADFRAGLQPRVADCLAAVPVEARATLEAELQAMVVELDPANAIAPRFEVAPVVGPITEAATILPAADRDAHPPDGPVWAIHEHPTLPVQDVATVAPGEVFPPSVPAQNTLVGYFGDYQIVRELARGGMGVVFQARQISLNRIVALKMILAGQLANDTDIKRFYTEAEAAANLDHPGIVPVFEVGQHQGQHFFSMGFIEGQSLAAMLANGPLPPRPAAEIMVKVAEAIDYAHQRGVIHRDLKPANILIDAVGNPRVTDFGLAKKLEGDSGLTGSGQIMGTPSYMPPEQAVGLRGEVGPAADIYSLGATLYALLTGRPPFQAASVMDTVLLVIGDDPVPPRRLNASIPRDLDVICIKCLEKDPARRYASAAALAQDLERWLRFEPILARRASLTHRVSRWARRRPASAALACLMVAAIAASIGVVLRDINRNRETIAAITKERNDAKNSEQAAVSARDLATRESTQNRRRLARMAIDNGNRWIEENSPFLALPWYVHALESEPDGPLAQRGHRIRLASVLSGLPRLTQLEIKLSNPNEPAPYRPAINADTRVPQGQVITREIHSPDRARRLLISAPAKNSRDIRAATRQNQMATILDSASNKPLFPSLIFPNKITDVLFVDQGRRFITVTESEPSARGASAAHSRSELRLWSAQDGTSIGNPISVPLAQIQLTLNAPGDRLLVRGLLFEEILQPSSECQVRDVQTLEHVILPRPGQLFREAVFSPDGRLVAAAPALESPEEFLPRQKADRDTPANPRSEKPLPANKTLHKRVDPGFARSLDGRLYSRLQGSIAYLYNTGDGEPLAASLDHSAQIERLAFAPNGHSLITSGHDLVREWRVPSGQPLLPELRQQSFLEFSTDSAMLLAKSTLQAPVVWSRESDQGPFTTPSPPLPAAGWSPTFRYEGNSVFAAPTQLAAQFRNHQHDVIAASRNPFNNLVETRTWSIRQPATDTVRMVPATTNILTLATDDAPTSDQSIKPGQAPVREAAFRNLSQFARLSLVQTTFAPDGKTFARSISQRSALMNVAAINPDGTQRAQPPSPIPGVELCSAESGKVLAASPPTSAQQTLVVYSANSRHILLVSSTTPAWNLETIIQGATSGGAKVEADLEFQILDLPALTPAGPPILLPKPVGSIALSPDGTRLAVMQVGTSIISRNMFRTDPNAPERTPFLMQIPLLNTLSILDLHTGHASGPTYQLPGSNNHTDTPVNSLLFSPNATQLLVRPARPFGFTAGHYALQPAHLIDTRTLKPCLEPLQISRTTVVGPQTTQSASSARSDERLAAFSPDGRLIAFADGGNVVGVFETATGKALDPTPSHTGRVLWIAFSPDGQRLATAGSEGGVRLWNTKTGDPIGPTMLHPGVTQLAFNADETFLLSAGRSGLIRIWDRDTAAPLTNGLNMRFAIDSIVLGPSPRQAIFGLQGQSIPIKWEIPIEERPLEELKALAIVLSGHRIDGGESLSPAPPAHVEAARATVVRHEPNYFTTPAAAAGK